MKNLMLIAVGFILHMAWQVAQFQEQKEKYNKQEQQVLNNWADYTDCSKINPCGVTIQKN